MAARSLAFAALALAAAWALASAETAATMSELEVAAAASGAGGGFGTCQTCVFVIERIKKGTNMLLPSICTELYAKYPSAYDPVRFVALEAALSAPLRSRGAWARATDTLATPAVPPNAQRPQCQRQQRPVRSVSLQSSERRVMPAAPPSHPKP
jgi:hypothetical protein